MADPSTPTGSHAEAFAIHEAALDAVRADVLVRDFLTGPASPAAPLLADARRIIVIGAGKAGTAMAEGVEAALADRLDTVSGLVNVLDEWVVPLQAIELHAGRPAGSNHPTEAGVLGTRRIIDLVRSAGPMDVVLALWSGGGSALLPAPAEGLSLADKQEVTHQLHTCGATIGDLNAVRKHLSASKGGRLAQAFTGKALVSLVLSDVVGDRLDVIASGPTVADPSTYADAWAVLERHRLTDRVPDRVRRHLQAGIRGEHPETLKHVPDHVHHFVIGNNQTALRAAAATAERLGYSVLNLGSFIEGETREVARAFAGLVRSIHTDGAPLRPPVCLLSGGETTVTLCREHGLGGRNMEFVLAALLALGDDLPPGTVILSAGTDGEDGPTETAGAIADHETLQAAAKIGFDGRTFLARNNSFWFFEGCGGLLQLPITGTNVMDLRVILIPGAQPPGERGV